jgi:hypothetical protein
METADYCDLALDILDNDSQVGNTTPTPLPKTPPALRTPLVRHCSAAAALCTPLDRHRSAPPALRFHCVLITLRLLLCVCHWSIHARAVAPRTRRELTLITSGAQTLLRLVAKVPDASLRDSVTEYLDLLASSTQRDNTFTATSAATVAPILPPTASMYVFAAIACPSTATVAVCWRSTTSSRFGACVSAVRTPRQALDLLFIFLLYVSLGPVDLRMRRRLAPFEKGVMGNGTWCCLGSETELLWRWT